ncbi:hypothetical protein SeMB42_g00450 [Synchytrium endobioticum]|uniref:Cytochrome b5 heme-binding domain-containing protein n=1 Tax=Synchytrium endobioticum TaxID=286115 RepID=A0A507DIN1_9FUNG|nr:hypothetical protein SeLEV6574_g00314 [Synchytrium endobioticum]TPX54072.1 hypothetical protein SeMB42_g00450 [Synchytrium endobioticum]
MSTAILSILSSLYLLPILVGGLSVWFYLSSTKTKGSHPNSSTSSSTTNTPSNMSSSSGQRSFTPAELSKFDGSNPTLPVYLAIKGTVFDVSAQRDMYKPGAGYHVFAGRDASRALGMSSLNPDDCVSDYSGLNPEDMETLDKWEAHYRKKYPVIGHVVTTSL